MSDYTLHHGDCLDVMAELGADSIDTIITDPPYGLSFMNKRWDYGVPTVPYWEAALRVAKPGAFMLAFGGTRKHHRLMCAIEDAGWELRDCVIWLYGSGFPKSHDISKGIDKSAGAEREVTGTKAAPGKPHFEAANNGGINSPERRASLGYEINITAPATDLAKQWDGWGTALKPAWEPIIVAMKPLDGTFAQNAERHGVAGLHIDAGRIEYQSDADKDSARPQGAATAKSGALAGGTQHDGDRAGFAPTDATGRWPANVILDESAGALLDEQSGVLQSGQPGIMRKGRNDGAAYGAESRAPGTQMSGFGDSGGASRFFYCAKASKSERNAGVDGDNKHPTVKPVALLRYLCKLTSTPTGGVVLDPFMGSGSTGVACAGEGRPFVGIELDAEYVEIARQRIEHARRQTSLFT